MVLVSIICHPDYPLKIIILVKLSCLDKLALRAGNEKDEDQADTVGCCSLRLEFNIYLSRDT